MMPSARTEDRKHTCSPRCIHSVPVGLMLMANKPLACRPSPFTIANSIEVIQLASGTYHSRSLVTFICTDQVAVAKSMEKIEMKMKYKVRSSNSHQGPLVKEGIEHLVARYTVRL